MGRHTAKDPEGRIRYAVRRSPSGGDPTSRSAREQRGSEMDTRGREGGKQSGKTVGRRAGEGLRSVGRGVAHRIKKRNIQPTEVEAKMKSFGCGNGFSRSGNLKKGLGFKSCREMTQPSWTLCRLLFKTREVPGYSKYRGQKILVLRSGPNWPGDPA